MPALLAAATFATAAGADERPPYRVVAFGDSYAAGEGAPGTPGVYDADGTTQTARGVVRERCRHGLHRRRRDRDARRAALPPLAAGDRAASGKALITRFPDIDFTFRSFACSGAAIDDGVMAPYDGAEPIDSTRSRRRSTRPTTTSRACPRPRGGSTRS